jgi:hypothetical protein
MKPTNLKVCGFFVFNWFHRLTDRIGRYERSGGGSIPSGITNIWRSNLAGARASLENCVYVIRMGFDTSLLRNKEE